MSAHTKSVLAAGGEGANGLLVNEDVSALSAAANLSADATLINPFAFVPPIAPHIAAMQVGIEIEIDKIMSAYTALSRMADVVIVEGVGGFRVPLGKDWDSADMALSLDLPVVLVVGMRLGCLNHALLTVESIKHTGLAWAGWVASILDPDMPALAENLAALELRLPKPCLGKLLASAQILSKFDDASPANSHPPKMYWNANISTLE